MTFIEEFGKKTVGELRVYAKENDIDLYGVSTKAQILEVIASFFPEVGKTEEEIKKIEKEKILTEKIAVYSTKNLHWAEVGSLQKGYNIVTKEMSEKWTTHKAVRLASAEEVAKYYGK